jgi:hypothetical protein
MVQDEPGMHLLYGVTTYQVSLVDFRGATRGWWRVSLSLSLSLSGTCTTYTINCTINSRWATKGHEKIYT